MQSSIVYIQDIDSRARTGYMSRRVLARWVLVARKASRLGRGKEKRDMEKGHDGFRHMR